MRFAVDDLVIHRIVEQETPSPDEAYRPQVFFPDLSDEMLEANRSWLTGNGLDPVYGNVLLCYQTYIVRTPHHTVLIDSCIGNEKNHPTRPHWHGKTDDTYMRALAAAGLSVEDIDFVLCTHLHADHVGWNTRLLDGRWVPTFPNARYLFSAKELNYWQDRHASSPIHYMTDSVLPVVAADRADLVTSDHTLNDHIRLEPTPGHTPDHFAVRVGRGVGSDRRSGGAVFGGDLIHSPLQARYPELSMRSDFDPALAARTRRAFLDRYCDTDTLVCTAHFPGQSVGRFTGWDDGFRFEPSE